MQSHGAAFLAKTQSILGYEMCTVLCNLGGYYTDNFVLANAHLNFTTWSFQLASMKRKEIKTILVTLTLNNTLFASRFSFHVLFLLLAAFVFRKHYFF